MARTRSAEVLETVERALAEHRAFGDSGYILNQLELCLKMRLEKLAGQVPGAGDLLDALAGAGAGGDATYPAIADTVVRCAIVHAHVQIETGAPFGLPLADCAEVFAATARRVEKGEPGPTVDDGSLRQVGPEPFHGWLWSDEHPSDVFGRTFRYLMKHRYDAIPGTPTEDDVTLLTQGAELLGELLPVLTPSALRHGRVIALVPDAGGWKGVASSSQFHLGGTVFLGRWLHNPWWVAEHLLHECLHQKLYDFRHGHSLLGGDLGTDDAPALTVWSPWNPPRLVKANQWDVHRVFAAFHVYVQVALLGMVAEDRAPELVDTYGSFTGMVDSRKSLERAHYLCEQLREHCRDHLGFAGTRMVDWLTSVLDVLDPAPPPKGAYVHLLLDRHEREENQVATALGERGSAPSIPSHALTGPATEEVDGVRRILSAIDARGALDSFDRALAGYREEELGEHFPEVRRIVRAALLEASVDGFRLTATGEHDELVRHLIEDASQRIFALLADYPTEVVAAKRRATDLRFTKSCQDEVGRLLVVLAAALPHGARVLEIGTGTGVGTAWIAAGLGERTDVEVISLEIDAGLSEAARSWPWPSHVRIVTADAREALPTLGTFDLVFADAAPVKYGDPGSVLATLRPGATLVVDDLDATVWTPERQRAEKDELRGLLLHHPDLRAVEIQGTTGVILASRPRSSAPVGAPADGPVRAVAAAASGQR